MVKDMRPARQKSNIGLGGQNTLRSAADLEMDDNADEDVQSFMSKIRAAADVV